MTGKLILISLFVLGGNFVVAQDIDFNPKILQRDLQKIWKADEVSLVEIEIPDSIYNDILLDNGKIYETFTEDKRAGFVYVGRIYSCRAGGCGMDSEDNVVSVNDDYEYFDYYALFNDELSVLKVRVYNYQATHGHEVGGSGWLRQFVGYSGREKLEYGKNIDSISGATISANAITYNIQEACQYLVLLRNTFEGQKQAFNTTLKK
jgi:hypothetical protein